MEFFVANAFTEERFGGNPAGVVLQGGAPFPPEAEMQRIAALIKHSETVFVRQIGGAAFSLRYYSPCMEVDLCGHATIAAFSVLREEKNLPPGDYRIDTRAGQLGVRLEPHTVWLDMAPGQIRQTLTREEALPVYAALGLGMTVAALMAICGVLFEPLGGGIFFIMVLVVLPVFVLRLRGEHEGAAA